MASAAQVEKLSANLKTRAWHHDPNATTPQIVTPDGGTTLRIEDMRDASVFGVAAMLTAKGAAGAITQLEIVASAAVDMSNPVVIKDSGTIAANALGDWAFVECSQAELAQLSSSQPQLRYAAGRLTCADATDEAAVTYISTPDRPHRHITPPTTIA